MSEKKNIEFVLRDSRLTEMFSSNKDIQSAYNLCFSIFVILCATTGAYYFLDTEKFYEDISWLCWCFGGSRFYILCLCWLRMQISTILILYPVIRIWLWIKMETQNQILINSRVDNTLLTIFSVCFQILLFWFGFDFILNHFLSPVCVFAFLCEQRTVTAISMYPKVHWRLVFWYFLQVFAVIFMMFSITKHYVEDNYRLTGIKAFEMKKLIYLLLSGALIGFQLAVFLFYGFLHCWLNAFAEMLRFGDRQFYNDWWNCTEFTTFYRKWNIVVHQWLRAYIYDKSLQLTGNRGSAALVVFFVSAVIHEYILALSFGYFLPILFSFYFIVGVFLFFVGKVRFKASIKESQSEKRTTNGLNTNYPKTSLSLGNMFFFLGITMGWGLMIMFYSMESYSRINCPINDKSLINYFWPRLFTCATII